MTTKPSLLSTDWKTILALAGGGIAIWYFVIKPDSDKEDQAKEDEITNLMKSTKYIAAMSPNFGLKAIKKLGYTSVNTYLEKKGLSTKKLQLQAKQIYDSEGIFNDDEDSLYNVFRDIKNIIICSILTEVFLLQHNADLNSYLSGFLNTEEMGKISKIINSKPMQ